MESTFLQKLKEKTQIIGMIHVDALPGTPAYGGDFKKILKKAILEAKIYQDCSIDAIAIENMHDTPYLNTNVGPEITAAMSVIGYEVKKTTGLPCGIQILAGANTEALAAALCADLDFIRAEGFVFSHIGDEGIFNSCAGKLLRYRKQIGAEHISIFTDIKKKHSSHAITSDVDIIETAHAAEFLRSDGVIITGISTGQAASVEELKTVKNSVSIPVLIGSGVTFDNIENYLPYADGLIIGSYFKEGGIWSNPIAPDKIKKLMKKIEKLRK
jgi:membrane complex biogenesis BtpA family protein